MHHPFRLLAALPLYLIGILIVLAGAAYAVLGELKACTMLVHGNIIGSFIAGAIYPIVAGIIFGIGAGLFRLGMVIHGMHGDDEVPAVPEPMWDTDRPRTPVTTTTTTIVRTRPHVPRPVIVQTRAIAADTSHDWRNV